METQCGTDWSHDLLLLLEDDEVVDPGGAEGVPGD